MQMLVWKSEAEAGTMLANAASLFYYILITRNDRMFILIM